MTFAHDLNDQREVERVEAAAGSRDQGAGDTK